MRLVLLLLLGFVMSPIVLSAQDRCGTIQTQEMWDNFRKNKTNWNTTINRGYVSRFVPVTFQMVADNAGEGRISQQACLRALCIINERYEAAGADMSFYLAGFEEINNSTLHVHPFGSIGFMNSIRDRASLNIFVVSEIYDRNGEPGGNVAGFYTPGADVVVVRIANLADPTYTAEHEIGHFFSLAHTHNGWEDLSYHPDDYPEKIEFLEIEVTTQGGGVRLVELVDGSNCEIAADEICDTPADYGHGSTCNCCDPERWTILDRNCDTLAPMMNNIMSYSGRCNTWEFTPDQIVAIQTDYDSPNRLYLRGGDVDQYTPITDPVVYIGPGVVGALEVHEIYDDILFDWEDVANAEYYELTVNGEKFITQESEYRITTLTANSFNNWSVVAYNVFGGGCVESSEILFRTGTGSSSVSDLDFVEDVNIYPNPLSDKDALSVQFNSTKSIDATLQLFNVEGKELYRAKVNFRSGLNSFSVPTQDIETGIYILNINTPEGLITEKIVKR